MSDAVKWKELLEALTVPDTTPELEESIHQHQTLIENITQAYTEVCTLGGGVHLRKEKRLRLSSGGNRDLRLKIRASSNAQHGQQKRFVH